MNLRSDQHRGARGTVDPPARDAALLAAVAALVAAADHPRIYATAKRGGGVAAAVAAAANVWRRLDQCRFVARVGTAPWRRGQRDTSAGLSCGKAKVYKSAARGGGLARPKCITERFIP